MDGGGGGDGLWQDNVPIVRGLAYVVDNAAAAYKKSTSNVQSFATNDAPQKTAHQSMEY